MILTELYPNGGTPPTTFTEQPSNVRSLPDTGANNTTGDLAWAGVIVLVLGVALAVINRQFLRRPKPRP